MRRISRSLAAVLMAGMTCGLLGALASCGHKEEVAAKPKAPSGDAVFSDKGVTLDGKLIPVPCTEAEITAVLGAPSRKEAMSETSTIFVWDDKGIIAYFKPGGDQGHAVDFVLRPGTYQFSPKGVFTHKVTVDGKTLGKGSPDSDIEAAGLKRNSPVPFLWQRKLGNLECDVTTDPVSKEVADINLERPAAP